MLERRGESAIALNHTRHIALSLISLLSGLVVFLLSSPPWDTPGAATVYYSILAFLSITVTVCGRARIRTDPSPAHTLFVGGTQFASVIFGGAALFYLFNRDAPVTHLYTSGIFLNLVAFAITGVTMFLYAYFQNHPPSEKSFLYNRYLLHLFVIFTVGLFVVLLIVSRIFLTASFFLLWGYVTGAIAVTTYMSAAYLLLKPRTRIADTHEPMRLALTFILLGAASTIHITLLPAPNSLWTLSILLTIVAFIYAIVSTGYQYLFDISVDEKIAYAIAVSISAIVIGPFLILQLIEGYIFMGTVVEIGAPLLIHIGGTIFAGSIAFSLFRKTRHRNVTFFAPLISILIFWTMA